MAILFAGIHLSRRFIIGLNNKIPFHMFFYINFNLSITLSDEFKELIFNQVIEFYRFYDLVIKYILFDKNTI